MFSVAIWEIEMMKFMGDRIAVFWKVAGIGAGTVVLGGVLAYLATQFL